MKNYFLLLLLISSVTAFSQDIDLKPAGKHINTFQTLENSSGNTLLETKSNHISFKGEAQPIIYRTIQKTIPDLRTLYFFFEDDSTISKINYEWDASTFSNDHIPTDDNLFVLSMIAKFDSLALLISNEYGKPITKGSTEDLSIINTKGGLDKSHKWSPNDSLDIQLYLILSNYTETTGMMTIPTTHRIRLNVVNKRKSKSKSPKAQNEEMLKSNAFNFFNLIKNKAYDDALKLFNEEANKNTSTSDLKAFRKMLKLNEKLELVYVGMQFTPTGNLMTMHQYKYSSDTSQPPKEIIKFIFDSEGKIFGVQPLKL